MNHKHRHDHLHLWSGLRGWLRGLLSHGHDPSLHPVLESSSRGIRALKVSLVALTATAALQLMVVSLSGSVALLGDTLHNFADALTAVPLWVAFGLGRRARTRRYTYGYGRAEDVAGIFIVLVVAVSAAVAGYEAVDHLLHPRPVEELGLVAAAALVGFGGNELVALYRVRVGREIGSAALVADGLHARVDGLTSLAVLVGALGVAAGYQVADPIMGLVITVAILFVLRDAAREIYYRLMDAVAPELVASVEDILRGVVGVKAVEDVRIRWIGHRLRAEAVIAVDDDLRVVEAHAIAVEAHHRLLHEVPRLAAAIIHVNPRSVEGLDYHADLAHHFPSHEAEDPSPRPPGGSAGVTRPTHK